MFYVEHFVGVLFSLSSFILAPPIVLGCHVVVLNQLRNGCVALRFTKWMTGRTDTALLLILAPSINVPHCSAPLKENLLPL